jgi:hypothetical protein
MAEAANLLVILDMARASFLTTKLVVQQKTTKSTMVIGNWICIVAVAGLNCRMALSFEGRLTTIN